MQVFNLNNVRHASKQNIYHIYLQYHVLLTISEKPSVTCISRAQQTRRKLKTSCSTNYKNDKWAQALPTPTLCTNYLLRFQPYYDWYRRRPPGRLSENKMHTNDAVCSNIKANWPTNCGYIFVFIIHKMSPSVTRVRWRLCEVGAFMCMHLGYCCIFDD